MRRMYCIYKAKKDLYWQDEVIYKEGEEIHDPYLTRATFIAVDAEDDDYILKAKKTLNLNRLGGIGVKMTDIERIWEGKIDDWREQEMRDNRFRV